MMYFTLSNLEKANHTMISKLPPILFIISEKKNKINLSDYQVYKLYTNPKDDKSLIYSLTVGIHEVEIPKE
eukprot:12991926-Ditylum_brightwellii.AAC.1